jgi:hypothetical protein
MRLKRSAIFGGALGLLVVGPLMAQRGFNFGPRELAIKNVPYDGRFTFARLKFTTGPGGYYYQGLPAWAHGYAKAENNLLRIVTEISTLHPRLDESNVFALDDPELFKYPVAMMIEADYWTMTDKEAEGLRKYFQKGGFVIFDDFRDDGRNGFTGWNNFVMQFHRAIPDARFIDVDPSAPIFHSFFEINSFDIIPQSYDRQPIALRVVYDGNDPSKRIIAMINFNTDVSDFWEFSSSGLNLVPNSNEAYKLGVNYLMYPLSH